MKISTRVSPYWLGSMIYAVLSLCFTSALGPPWLSAQPPQINESKTAAQPTPSSTGLSQGTLAQGNVPYSSEEVDRLIDALASDQFDERQIAFNRLVEIGEPAIEKLKAALVECDQLEQKVRLQALLFRIRDFVQRNRMDAFLRDTDPDKDYGMKAWPRFREIVGGNRTCRLMFIEIYQKHPELADMVVDNPEGAVEAAAIKAGEIRTRLFSGQPLELGDGLALLFVGACTKTSLTTETESILRRTIFFNPLADKFTQAPLWRTPLQKLLNAWIIHISDASAYDALELSDSHRLTNGAMVARRVLALPNVDNGTLAFALFVLGEYGSKEDLPLITPFLENVTDWSPPMLFNDGRGASPFQSKLQDVALASCVQLTSQQLKDYFPHLERYQDLSQVRRPELLSFPVKSPELRTEALEKYRKKQP